MKNFLSLLFLVLNISIILNAQDQTLFGKNEITGAFGGPFFEYGTVDGDFGTAAGGGGAVVLRNFFIGGFGVGGDYSDKFINNQRYDTNLGYGGLWLGYVYPSDKLLHLYSSLKLGWGSAKLDPKDDDDQLETYKDPIFALTPEIGFEINVFKWFRIAATGGYRFVAGIDNLPQLSNDDFNNFNFGLTLRFGKFGNRGADDDDDDEDDEDDDDNDDDD